MQGLTQQVDLFRKRLESKDNELNHLTEINVRLKEKILEF